MKHIWKTFALVAAIGLSLGTAQAGTILVVSDAQVPGVAGGNHNDDSLVTFLEGLGHMVDTSGMNGQMKESATSPFAVGNEGKLQALNNADLVIVSRRTGSGSYDNDRKGWNELGTPLILMSGYLTRGETSSKKWGWTVGGSGNASKAEEEMIIEAAQGSHPFVAGVSSPVQLFDWSGRTPAEAPKPLYLPNASGSDPVAGAVMIGKFDGRAYLLDIPQGTDFDTDNGTAGKYGIAGARRAFMGHWGYDDGYPNGTNGSDGGPADFADYVTADFEIVLGNVVTTMVPEPGTITMLIAGLLGLAFYGWRRRS